MTAPPALVRRFVLGGRAVLVLGTCTVNGASVVCGNVQTANATIYIIGTVLMPSR